MPREASGSTVSFSYDSQTYNLDPDKKEVASSNTSYVDSTKEADVPQAPGTSSKPKQEATKEKVEEEYYTLTGTLNVTPSKKLQKVKTGESITLEGLGMYLSGDYLVECRNVTLSADSGFSVSYDLLKTGFAGNSLKGTMKVSEE